MNEQNYPDLLHISFIKEVLEQPIKEKELGVDRETVKQKYIIFLFPILRMFLPFF